MLTRFRSYVLQTIYEFSRKEFGDLLKSATVSVYYDYYEPVPPALVLGIVADVDGQMFGRVHRSAAESVATESLLWSDAEKEDFRESIHYELVPLNI